MALVVGPIFSLLGLHLDLSLGLFHHEEDEEDEQEGGLGRRDRAGEEEYVERE